MWYNENLTWKRYFRSNYSIATTCFDYKTLLDTNAHYYNVTVCISSHNKFIFYSLFFKKGRIKLSNIVKYELSQKMFCCCTVQYLLIIKIDLLLVSRLSFIDCRITSFVLMIDQMNVYLVYWFISKYSHSRKRTIHKMLTHNHK